MARPDCCRFGRTEMGWRSEESLEGLFRNSDMVTLHMSATDATGASNRGRITRDLLFSLGAERPENSPRVFLNLSRGFLHSAEDLIDAVEAGRIRRASTSCSR